jgi:hypothetical protein
MQAFVSHFTDLFQLSKFIRARKDLVREVLDHFADLLCPLLAEFPDCFMVLLRVDCRLSDSLKSSRRFRTSVRQGLEPELRRLLRARRRQRA